MSPGPLAGPLAQDALDALVQQFTQRSAFVRELVQNSLDASASRIDLRQVPDGRDWLIEVIDDGEGMDRAIIEGCLLTLFRSSKEEDLTKIGKFGVGFVSLFALEPLEVSVETGRDGQAWRVVFDRHRAYRLYALDMPVEGTTVQIRCRASGPAARKLAEEVDQALHYWCRFARAEVWSACEASGWGWPLKEVSAPFDIDASIKVVEEGPGFRAVVGLSGHRPSLVGYHNRGLTLLETREDVIPGVSFRVEARTLEHTLTRDNVLRDAHFATVIQRIRTIAAGPLRARWHAALQAACEAGDDEARVHLLKVAMPGVAEPPDDLPCFASPTGDHHTLSTLRPGLLRRFRKSGVLWAPPGSALGAALEAAGHRVLCGPSPDHPDALVAHLLGCGELHEASALWWCAEPALPPPVMVEADRLGRAEDLEPAGLFAAHFGDGPHGRRLALRQQSPGVPRLIERSGDESGVLVINVDHPLVQALAGVSPSVGAPVLLRAASVAATGAAAPLNPVLARALGSALVKVQDV